MKILRSFFVVPFFIITISPIAISLSPSRFAAATIKTTTSEPSTSISVYQYAEILPNEDPSEILDKPLSKSITNSGKKDLFINSQVGNLQATTVHGDILITELFINPSESPEKNFEWIELYNTSSQAIDLDGWKLLDNLSEDILPSFLIEPESSLIIKTSQEALSSYTGPTLIIEDGSIGNQLGNSGDKLILLNSEDVIIDQLSWGNNKDIIDPPPSSPLEDYSLHRINFDDQASSSTYIEDNPSPGIIYSNESPFYETGLIIINEFLPNPDSNQSEFIELFNHGIDSIDLSNWILDDQLDGGSSPFLIPPGTIISPNAYLVFSKESLNISDIPISLILNNDQDSINLFSPDNKLQDSYSYDNTTTGISFARDASGNWQETMEVTAGHENVISIPSDQNESENEQDISIDDVQSQQTFTAIEDVKKKPIGEIIITSGWISSPPDNLGKNRLYIMDKNNGIAVEMSGGLPSNLKLGNEISVTGEIGEKYSEKFIKANSIEVTSSQHHSFVIESIKTKSGNEEMQEGKLVSISGKITRQSGDTFYVDDGSGELRILIKTSTGINKPSLSKGMDVKISGIISQYKTASTVGNGYRLLPRFQDDISFQLVKTGSNHYYLVSYFMFIILVYILFIFQMKRIKGNLNSICYRHL